MRVKRVTAPDMRQAISIVRQTLGGEAVILSNQRTEQGVEVVAAVDFDEAQYEAWQAQQRGGPPAATPTSARPTVTLPATPPLRDARVLDPREMRPLAPPAAPDLASVAPRQAPAMTPAASMDVSVEAANAHAAGVVGAGAGPDRAAVNRPVVLPSELPPTILRAVDVAGADRGPTDGVEIPPLLRQSRGGGGGRRRERAGRVEDLTLSTMQSEVRQLKQLFERQLELLEWQQFSRLHPAQSGVFQRLLDMDLSPALAEVIVSGLEHADEEAAWAGALLALADRLPELADELLDAGRPLALIGPTGVGKTTSVAKLAARAVLRHGRAAVALISTDNFRVGGYDQLRSYARILEVPIRQATTAAALREALDAFAGRRVILIDTAGMGQRDARLFEQFRALMEVGGEVAPVMVLSANTQRATLADVLRQFRDLKPVAAMITKLDEAARLGPVLDILIRTRMPVAYLGVGQRVPEDLQLARPDRLVQWASALVDEVTESFSEDGDELSAGALWRAGAQVGQRVRAS